MDRVTLSDKNSLIFSHYYITTLFRFLNLEQVFDVPSLIPWARPLERGSALMTKAGTDQQTFNFARISSSGVQILLVTPSHFEFCFLKWKSGEDNQKEIRMVVPVWIF